MTDDTEVIRTLYDCAHEKNVEVSALSWNGFNIMGDRKSIDEVHRLMYAESRLIALEQRISSRGI